MDQEDNILGLTRTELKKAEDRTSVGVRVVHEAVRREGEVELKRSSSALAWSGLAAGLSMGFSLIGEGVLFVSLPDTPWRPLISKFGYTLGFVIAILGRQQLFTETTLTPILPLLAKRDAATVVNVARLWAVVLSTNLAGALAIALVLGHTGAVSEDVRNAFGVLGLRSVKVGFGLALLRGIFAGWLLALLVWMLPFAESARFFVIVTFTWVIGVCGFTHVVAGSVEAFFVAGTGLASWPQALGGYILPALIGNILGGVSLVGALAHVQVAS